MPKRNNLRRPKSMRPPCTTIGTATDNIINNLRSRPGTCPRYLPPRQVPGHWYVRMRIFTDELWPWYSALLLLSLCQNSGQSAIIQTSSVQYMNYLFPQMIKYWEWYRSPHSKQWGKKQCMITYDGLSSPCHVTSSWNFCDLWPATQYVVQFA